MEELSETRNELIGGAVVAKTGSNYAHVLMVGNLLVELNRRLRGKSCEVVCNALRVKTELTSSYFYPDLVGICGAPVFDGPGQVTLLNPTLLIEVLSPSTEAYDRGQKFLHYQQMPTLKEYVLVSREAARVELFTRGENSEWKYKMVSGTDASAHFPSIDCTVALADIYRDVGLGEQKA
jgi:Uma2 family endonuclease